VGTMFLFVGGRVGVIFLLVGGTDDSAVGSFVGSMFLFVGYCVAILFFLVGAFEGKTVDIGLIEGYILGPVGGGFGLLAPKKLKSVIFYSNYFLLC
jgi:hypothetical protein